MIKIPQKIVMKDNSLESPVKTTVLFGNKITRYFPRTKRLYVVDIDLFCGERVTLENVTKVSLTANGAILSFHVEGKDVTVELSASERLEIKTSVLSGTSGELVVKIAVSSIFGDKPILFTDFDGRENVFSKKFLRGKTENVIKIL